MKSLACEHVRELLGNYIDENLTEQMRAVVTYHLARCKYCHADLKTLQATVAQLAANQSIEAPSPWFADRLLRSLARNNDTSLTPIEQPVPTHQLNLW